MNDTNLTNLNNRKVSSLPSSTRDRHDPNRGLKRQAGGSPISFWAFTKFPNLVPG